MEGQDRAPARARQRDPLLAAARLAFGMVTGLSLFTAAAFCLAMPFVLVIRDKVLAYLVAKGAPPEAIWGIITLQLLAAVAAILAFYFFRHLYRIIDTVGEGDPFVPVNAQRLMAMGWISIASHVLAIPLNLASQWLETFSDKFRFEIGLSLAGILLTLILFVLARVFREGARMREELEGTV